MSNDDAMKLADRINSGTDWYEFDSRTWCTDAAAELRRLVAENKSLRKVAEETAQELSFLNGDLLYWVDRAVSKGNANANIEDSYERYEAWIQRRAAKESK
jgi:hypothetical protein